MMKRITAMVLAMLLALSMSTAYAWTCPTCGADMETKFCSECGTKKPENICASCGTNHGETVLNYCTECGARMAPEPVVTPEPAPEGPAISQVTENGNGTVTVMWNADGVSKYTVEYIQRKSDDPQADRDARNGFYTRQNWYSTGECSITRLIPGERYWIGVFDEQGRGEYVAYDPAVQPGAFSEFAISVNGRLMIEKDGVQTEAGPVTAKDIANGEKVGLYLAMEYNNPGEAKEYVTQIVLKASNGDRWVLASQSKFGAKTASVTGWKFVNLADYFARMQSCFGLVLMGNYKAEVYVNGALAGEVPFRVEQNAAPTAAPTAVPTAAPTAAPTANPPATPVPTEEVRARLEDVVSNGDGTVTVSWNGGVAPYKVQYTRKMSEDFNADRSAARERGDYWNAVSATEETSAVIGRLIPGEEYWVVVLDANEKGQRRAFTNETSAFTDFPVTLELMPRERIGETPADIPCIPADTAGAEDTAEHGLFIQINHENPGEARDYYMQIVTSFSNGFEYVYGTGTVNFASGEGCWRKWEFYSLDDLMVHLRKYYGQIPAGDLTITVYLDGKLACEGKVPVGEASGLRITSCTEQSGGLVHLAWEDNGNVPYTVYYHERFTNDAKADSKSGRSLGRLYAQMELMEASCEFNCLTPGRDYWITVADSKGEETVIPFSMAPAAKSELNITLDYTYQQRNNGVPTELSGFSAAVLNQDYEERTGYAESYGLNVKINCSNLPGGGGIYTLPYKWVVTLPNGASDFCGAFEYVLLKDANPQREDYCDMDPVFNLSKYRLGEVLKGDYIYTLYVDGKHACDLTFTVGD